MSPGNSAIDSMVEACITYNSRPKAGEIWEDTEGRMHGPLTVHSFSPSSHGSDEEWLASGNHSWELDGTSQVLPRFNLKRRVRGCPGKCVKPGPKLKDDKGKPLALTLLVDLWPSLRDSFSGEDLSDLDTIDSFFTKRGTNLDPIPLDAMAAVLAVRHKSLETYADPANWQQVPLQRWREAAARHAVEHLTAEGHDGDRGIDKQSGLPHMAHFWTNVAIIRELERRQKEKLDGLAPTSRIYVSLHTNRPERP